MKAQLIHTSSNEIQHSQIVFEMTALPLYEISKFGNVTGENRSNLEKTGEFGV